MREALQYMTLAGFKCWMLQDSFKTELDYDSMISTAIEKSKCILFFSSESSNESKWAIREIEIALKSRKPIIPIKLDDAPYAREIYFGLSHITCLASNLKRREDLETLLKSVSYWLDKQK